MTDNMPDKRAFVIYEIKEHVFIYIINFIQLNNPNTIMKRPTHREESWGPNGAQPSSTINYIITYWKVIQNSQRFGLFLSYFLSLDICILV